MTRLHSQHIIDQNKPFFNKYYFVNFWMQSISWDKPKLSPTLYFLYFKMWKHSISSFKSLQGRTEKFKRRGGRRTVAPPLCTSTIPCILASLVIPSHYSCSMVTHYHDFWGENPTREGAKRSSFLPPFDGRMKELWKTNARIFGFTCLYLYINLNDLLSFIYD